MTKNILVVLGTVLALGIILVGGAYWWVTQQLQPVSTTDTELQTFVVAKGQALGVTANELAEQGLIRHPQVFRYYAQFNDLDTKMQAGSYKISPNMSTQQIALSLTEGTEDTWITLPEGWRREEVAEYLDSQDELEFFNVQEFLDVTEGYEGYLFPDTYLIPRESSAEQIFTLLTNTFDKKVSTGLAKELADSELSKEEVVVLASIVEREGKGYENMRQVAGVLLNRIEIGMALQADATLQYIEGQDDEGNWWSAPSVASKQSASGYNTYQVTGLPPAPIASPGLDAIRAVLDPMATNDYYYIHTPSGESYFSETLEEHNANIDRYLR